MYSADDGRPVRMVGTLVDVTDRHADRRLRESEERFRQMAEHIDAVLFVSEPDLGRVLYVSPAYERVWGRPVRALYESPRSFIDDIHPEDRQHVAAVVSDPGRAGEVEYRVVPSSMTVQRSDATR